MQFGIFESVLQRSTLLQTLQAVRDREFSVVQFDLGSAGIESLPEAVSPETIDAVVDASKQTGVGIAALSGTFNMAHPDPVRRSTDLARFRELVSIAPRIGTRVVTLCSGTRDRTSMWRKHPDNGSVAVWRDFRATLATALEIAAEFDVILGVEPEPANVIDSAPLARRLLDEVADPHLGIILDPANIVLSDRSRDPGSVLDEAFGLLGGHIIHAHAKDLSKGGAFCPAGTGIVPWDQYRELLVSAGYKGPIIFHTLRESDIEVAMSMFNY